MNVRKLLKKRKQCKQIMKSGPYESYEELLKRTRMKSLYEIRLENIAIFMFKTKYGLQPKNISDLFQQKTVPKYNIRNDDFQVQRFKTVQYGKHSLRHIGPALWAKLPKETRDLKTLGAFKEHIRNLNLKELIREQGGCGSLEIFVANEILSSITEFYRYITVHI